MLYRALIGPINSVIANSLSTVRTKTVIWVLNKDFYKDWSRECVGVLGLGSCVLHGVCMFDKFDLINDLLARMSSNEIDPI